MKPGDATRERLLAAASEEFAAYGIAGARVDRIAANAQANKAQLYAFYGSKEALFERVFSTALDGIVNAVPIDGKDLPGYAVRLYNEYLEHPELVRLATWARLERRPAGHLTADADRLDSDKLANIADAQNAGYIDKYFTPFEVLTTVIAISMTWSPASTTFTATSADAPAEHQRRRDVLTRIVHRTFAPANVAGAGRGGSAVR
ncbi:TetR/AcrR family transcriptional regulator [Arthrobacter sunyaminii]|uniref:TetR family transcriptional regulator n=1 Tax=Arthrobacter sunyaminii TaxID=2816859 RepID=A0A975S810_9MICC|nr:TetR family transcriptional regulator [Arthrobacter sunyaminii]MBO0906736.1 TetR family transcriptional regulator [Arthrobacter sunyaminii]QWQ37511.1 TetR family transcriptional regulator [Arthrobacter sunyaminii]